MKIRQQKKTKVIEPMKNKLFANTNTMCYLYTLGTFVQQMKNTTEMVNTYVELWKIPRSRNSRLMNQYTEQVAFHQNV